MLGKGGISVLQTSIFVLGPDRPQLHFSPVNHPLQLEMSASRDFGEAVGGSKGRLLHTDMNCLPWTLVNINFKIDMCELNNGH